MTHRPGLRNILHKGSHLDIRYHPPADFCGVTRTIHPLYRGLLLQSDVNIAMALQTAHIAMAKIASENKGAKILQHQKPQPKASREMTALSEGRKG